MNEKLKHSLLKLPRDQRISLAGEMWDSLTDEDVPTPPDVRRTARERLDRYRQGLTEVMTLAQFRKKCHQLMKGSERKRRRSA